MRLLPVGIGSGTQNRGYSGGTAPDSHRVPLLLK